MRSRAARWWPVDVETVLYPPAPAGRLNGALAAGRGRAAGLLRNNLWGLMDHGLISGTNFVTMVLLARGLGEVAFGTFTLVYTLLLFANSFQDALVNQPHNVIGPTRGGEDYRSFTASTGVGQLLLLVAATVLSLLGYAVARSTGSGVAPLLLALAAAVFAWQAQEFLRRIMYTENRLGAALVNDLIAYGVQAVGIAALWRLHRLTGASALYALAATSFAGALLGCWQVRHSLRGRFQAVVLRENWRFGRWLAGGEAGRWFSAEAYLYLSAALLGAAAAGILKAAQVLFGPLRILMLFLYTVLPTRFSRALAEEGEEALQAQLRLAFAVAVPIVSGYCLLMAFFAGPILRLAYGSEYANSAHIVVLYASFIAFGHLGQLVGTALRARQLSRPIFIGQLGAGVLSIPTGWLFIQLFGLPGAVLSMTLTSVVVLGVSWFALAGQGRGRLVPVLVGGGD
ncbi:MAG TPA: oligosaccharide flippase family protein [Thermomicrobiaceae bacterium]|nr:oligosaccharide flippase family protein [Thermomicrobiaceae bacterium]